MVRSLLQFTNTPFPAVLLALGLGSCIGQAAWGQGFEALAQWIPETPSFSEDVGAGAAKSELMQSLEEKTRTTQWAGPVASPSCTLVPTITDFFEVPIPGKKAAEVSAPVDPALLRKTNPSLQELWSILRSTAIGAAILKKFEPKYGYEVRVVFSDLKNTPKRAPSSAALYRPADKTILIQRDREAGQIAFVLLHEMVHALDGDYRRALEREKEMRSVFLANVQTRLQQEAKGIASRGMASSTAGASHTPLTGARKTALVSIESLERQYEGLRQFRDMRVYRAERFAYDASYQAWVELSTLYPDYYQGRGLAGQPQRYSDDWLAKILKVKGTYLEKYRLGECRAVQNLDAF